MYMWKKRVSKLFFSLKLPYTIQFSTSTPLHVVKDFKTVWSKEIASHGMRRMFKLKHYIKNILRSSFRSEITLTSTAPVLLHAFYFSFIYVHRNEEKVYHALAALPTNKKKSANKGANAFGVTNATTFTRLWSLVKVVLEIQFANFRQTQFVRSLSKHSVHYSFTKFHFVTSPITSCFLLVITDVKVFLALFNFSLKSLFYFGWWSTNPNIDRVL